ncbi:MAG: ABC transporter permease [Oscillospiraceae bacterium]|jgi:spermidine/putrescine transport system permease protein|nr:ABC transporter permease [Oscillospiraceae bacterium]
MKRKRGSLALNAPYLLWCVIFILVPLAMVVYYAFRDRSGNWTLQNFAELVDTPEHLDNLVRVFGISLAYAGAATLICLLLAYPLAYYMAHTKPSTQRNLMMLITVPMWMNFLICTYSWISILGNEHGLLNTLLEQLGLHKLHILNTPGAIILGMVYNYLPFMILPIYSVLAKLEPSLVEAAQDLGATNAEVLRKVTLPLSLPGVAAGVTMVFVPSVSTFYISKKMGGNKTMLIGDWIESMFLQANNYQSGAALSLILMLLVVLSMMIMRRFSDSENGALVVS